jgi:hypothetical protein
LAALSQMTALPAAEFGSIVPGDNDGALNQALTIQVHLIGAWTLALRAHIARSAAATCNSYNPL